MASSIEKLNLQPDFREAHKDFARKALLALAGIVAGIAILLFLAAHWAAVGVGVILISAYSLYHMADKYHSSKYYLTKAEAAIDSPSTV